MYDSYKKPFIGGAIGTAIGGKIAGVLIDKVTEALVKTPDVPVSRENVVIVKPQIREAVVDVIQSDPVLKNELNAEKPVQSRVLWGNFIAGLGSLPTAIIGFLPVLVALGILEPGQAAEVRDGINATVQGVGGLIAIGGVAYSVYGRLKSGLAPLFSRAK